MTDVMQGLVTEAKKNKFSTIGPNLSDDDVVSVWDNVSAFIEKQMSQQKGLCIPGLGTFTFSQKKLDVGNNKFILIQRPVFLLSEKFAQTHGLTSTKHHTTGQIPVVQLNYSALSFESPFDRDTVEACVKEVLSALQRSVSAKKNVEFTFTGIGRLQIRDSKVKMKFYKDFLNSMDGSGKLVAALKDGNISKIVLGAGDSLLSIARPGTVDSVMSDRCPSRPFTGVHFPKIGHGGLTPEPEVSPSRKGDVPNMPPITEEAGGGEEEAAGAEDQLLGQDTEEAELREVQGGEGDADGEDIADDAKKPSPPPGHSRQGAGSRIAVPLAKATGVSFFDDLMMASPKPDGPTPQVLKSSPTPMMMKRSLSPLNVPVGGTPRSAPGPASRTPDHAGFHRSMSMDRIQLNKLPGPPGEKPPTPPGSACGHPNAGQELCYLCHQRDRKNIPVSFTEERTKREREEDRLLQQYQHLKDTEAIIKEQETLLGKRHDNQKVAAFNLGVSEAVKQKVCTRSTDFHPSYVFQKRPLTPPRFIKQEMYFGDLADQVNSKDETAKKRKADEEFLERLEQVQLAEDLAAQREQFLSDKVTQQDQYKRALSAQIRVRDCLGSPITDSPKIRASKRMGPVAIPKAQIILPFSQTFTMKIQEGCGPNSKVLKFKPLPMPARVSDSSEPIFGKNDVTEASMADKRRRAHSLYKEQLVTVEQRKREAILQRLNEQKEEEDMLKKTRKELLEDRAGKFGRLFMNRKRLEDDWAKAAELKGAREVDERHRARSPGMLVHEQCDKYRRCGQCKRRLHNCGESNIWRESRYIPGSRLMV